MDVTSIINSINNALGSAGHTISPSYPFLAIVGVAIVLIWLFNKN